MPRQLVNGVTVLGNLAIDVINGAPEEPRRLRVVRRRGAAKPPAAPAASSRWAPNRTTRCSIRCSNGSGPGPRSCPPTAPARSGWTTTTSTTAACPSTRSAPSGARPTIEAADPDTTWVHLAPLLRTDFPAETLALLDRTRPSRRLRRAGPGPRRPSWGRSSRTATFPPTCCRHISVLKLAEDEAVIVADGPFDDGDGQAARRAGDPGDVRLRGLRHLHRRRRRPRSRGVAGRGRADHGRRRHVHRVLRGQSRGGRRSARGQPSSASELVARELEKRLHAVGSIGCRSPRLASRMSASRELPTGNPVLRE